MSDAGEVLLALYGRIEALDAEAAQELAAAFGLRVQEYVYCESCVLDTHKHSYTQYFYNTQVGAGWVAEGGRVVTGHAELRCWAVLRRARLQQLVVWWAVGYRGYSEPATAIGYGLLYFILLTRLGAGSVAA